jgi:hypothetical protein
MKISEEVLNEGRLHITNADLDGFLAWVKTNAPTINISAVKDAYSVIFRLKDTERGLKFFNKVFPEYDIAEEMATLALARYLGLLLKGIFIIMFFGALGGIVYLFRSCAGV